jgi:hypothetical protein
MRKYEAGFSVLGSHGTLVIKPNSAPSATRIVKAKMNASNSLSSLSCAPDATVGLSKPGAICLGILLGVDGADVGGDDSDSQLKPRALVRLSLRPAVEAV